MLGGREFEEVEEWFPGKDERDEDRQDMAMSGGFGNGKSREVGKFYRINPPQAAPARPLAGFDPATFQDRGPPKLASRAFETKTFARAMFYGRAEDHDWVRALLKPELIEIMDELYIYIGKGVGDTDQYPWMMIVVHGTTSGSTITNEDD